MEYMVLELGTFHFLNLRLCCMWPLFPWFKSKYPTPFSFFFWVSFLFLFFFNMVKKEWTHFYHAIIQCCAKLTLQFVLHWYLFSEILHRFILHFSKLCWYKKVLVSLMLFIHYFVKKQLLTIRGWVVRNISYCIDGISHPLFSSAISNFMNSLESIESWKGHKYLQCMINPVVMYGTALIIFRPVYTWHVYFIY